MEYRNRMPVRELSPVRIGARHMPVQFVAAQQHRQMRNLRLGIGDGGDQRREWMVRDQLARHLAVTNFERTRRVQSRSEGHTSELQSLMRNSYAVFCLKKKKIAKHTN